MKPIFSRIGLLLLGCALWLAVCPVQAAEVIYVNQAVAASGNGTSWNAPYKELRDALNDARVNAATIANPVEIWIAKGTYKPTDTTNRTHSFTLRSNLRLIGGFAGTEASSATRRFYAGGIATNATVLSGDIGLTASNLITHTMPVNTWETNSIFSIGTANTDNSINVLTGVGVTNIVLDGLVVTGGYAEVDTNTLPVGRIESMRLPDPTSQLGDTLAPLDRRAAGGGLFFANAPGWYHAVQPVADVSLTVSNCTFIGNHARGFGGGIAISESHVRIRTSVFYDNVAVKEGGAIWGNNQLLDVRDTYFALNGTFETGGAIHLEAMPSLRSFLPMFTEGDFRFLYGKSKGEAIRGLQSYLGNLNSVLDVMQANVSLSGFYTNQANDEFKDRVTADSLAIGKSLLILGAKKTSLGASFFKGVRQIIGPTASRAMTVYGGITTFLAGSDLAFQLINLIPGLENNADYQRFLSGWTTFYDGFNTYATPGGLLQLGAKAVIDDLFPRASYEKRASELRLKDYGFYTKMPVNKIINCQFKTNSVGGTGGAIMALHENLHVEACLFDANRATMNAGAVAMMGYVSPTLANNLFVNNHSMFGNSAVANSFRTLTYVINCSFLDNVSESEEGYAMGNDIGADVFVANSIFWGNINAKAINAGGGADIYTAVRGDLDEDARKVHDEAGDGKFGWIGMTDVRNSCIQSLRRMPLGTPQFHIPDGASFDRANALGTLFYSGFPNVGEGNLRNLTNAIYGNIDSNPLISGDGFSPSSGSPVIDAGRQHYIFHHRTNSASAVLDEFSWTLTGGDVFGRLRFMEQADMGAVESFRGAPTPQLVYIDPFDEAGLFTAATVPGSGGRTAGRLSPETPGSPSSLINLYINANVVGGDGTGRNWANAMRNFPSRINLAVGGGGAVWVAKGTYDLSEVVYVEGNFPVHGGFNGTETSLSQGDPVANPTIVTTTRDIHALIKFLQPGGYHLQGIRFVRSGAGDGVVAGGGGVVTNCVFNGFSGVALRTANFLDTSISPQVTVGGCVFTGNSGDRTFVSEVDRLILRNSVFATNTSGTVLDLSGEVTNYVQGCTFSYNTKTSLDAGNRLAGTKVADCRFANNGGPAIESFTGRLVVENTEFTRGSGGAQGGAAGIWLKVGGLATISNSRFQQNNGPAILAASGYVGATVSGCTFENNSGAPAIEARGSRMTVLNSTFTANNFEGEAAGIHFYTGEGTAKACIFERNTGRAVSVTGGVGTLEGCSFQENIGHTALYCWTQKVTIKNCEFTGINQPGGTSSIFLDRVSNVQIQSTVFHRNKGNAVTVRADSVASTVQFAGCQFNDNQQGVVIDSDAWNTEVLGCQFARNSNDGDVLKLNASRAGVVMDSTFRGNSGNGSLIYSESYRTTVAGSVFEQNSFAGGASGVRIEGRVGYGLVQTSRFTNNVGSAVISAVPSLVVEKSRFSRTSGGAVRAAGSYLTVKSSQFERNTANAHAGAVSAPGHVKAQIFGSSFFANEGGAQSGAVYIQSNMLDLFNCTFHGNLLSASDAQGGAALRHAGSNGTCSIGNSIFHGNRTTGATSIAVEKQQLLASGSFNSSLRTSIIEKLATLTNPVTSDCFDVDPRFVDAQGGDLQLRASSHAINRADSSLVPSELWTGYDLLGTPLTSTHDIGAFECRDISVSSIALANATVTQVPLCVDGVPQVRLSTSVAGGGSRFQWEMNLNDGQGFVPLKVNGVAVPLSVATVTLTNPPASLNGIYIRVATTEDSPRRAVTKPVRLVTHNSVLHVNVNAPESGAKNGTSWADAYTSVAAALEAAGPCVQIWVAEGTYEAASGTGYLMRPGIQLYGGFAGTETALGQRDTVANPTILRFTGQTVGVEFSGASLDSGTVLDGFTFDYAGTQLAISVSAASPQIRNCTFSGSSRTSIIVSDNARPLLTNCRFLNNSQTAVINYGGQPVIQNCVFSGNSASSAPAIGNYSGTVTVRDSAFLANSSTMGGSAIDNTGTLELERCRLLNNSGRGGVIANSGRGKATIEACLLARNQGGAIHHRGDSLVVQHTTIAYNTSTTTQFGAGLYLLNTSWDVRDSILWGNSSTDKNDRMRAQIYMQQMPTVVSDRLVANFIDGYPEEFVALASNQDVDPLFADAVNDDYQLTARSPAINSSGSPLHGTDLAGRARPFGITSDAGCFEFQGPALDEVRLAMVPTGGTNCASAPVVFQIIGGRVSNNTYQWQRFDGSTFTNLLSTPEQLITQQGRTNTLTLSAAAEFAGAKYRVVVNGGLFTSPDLVVGSRPILPLYVNGTAAPGGDGASWNTAFRTVTEAFAVAGDCNQIWVAQGTYAAALDLRSGVQLYGGFDGTETSLAERNPVSRVTRLVPDGTTYILRAGVNVLIPADHTTVVDGFHLSGAASAIKVFKASPVIRQCVFEGNTVAIDGFQGNGLLIENSVFQNNNEPVYLYGTVGSRITGCRFLGNSPAAARGVVSLVVSTNAVLHNSLFQTNTGRLISGEHSANLVVTEGVFRDNQLGEEGVHIYHSTAGITNCQFSGNFSPEERMTIRGYNSRIAMERCLWTNNTGTTLDFEDSRVILRDSLVAHNGGATSLGTVRTDNSELDLHNVTLAYNRFSNDSVAMRFVLGSFLDMTNSIVWGNRAVSSALPAGKVQLSYDSSQVILRNSIVEEYPEVSTVSSFDPLFVDAANGDFHLLPFSPAIATGSPQGVTGSTVDLEGELRLRDGKVDLGAYAFTGTAATPLFLKSDLAARSVCVNGNTTFLVQRMGDGVFTLAWEVDRGAGFVTLVNDAYHTITPLDGGQSLQLTIAPVDQSPNGYRYRYVVSGAVSFTSQPAPLTVSARTQFYVDANAAGGDGTTWGTAFKSLGTALSMADSCTTIWVAGGVYPQTGGFVIPPGTEIYGGFPAGGAWGDRNPALHHSIITANAGHDPLLWVINQAETAGRKTILDGFHFKNCSQALSTGPSSAIIRNSVFENISHTAVFVMGGSPTVQNCLFTNNTGVAIGAGDTSLTINQCVFTNTAAVNGSHGIRSVYSRVTVTNSGFYGLKSSAIIAVNGELTVERSRFTGNSALRGGAIYGQNTVVTVRGSLFDRNAAGDQGGAVYASEGKGVRIYNSTLTDNTAGYAGAAVALQSLNFSFINSIMWGNSVLSGRYAGSGQDLARTGGSVEFVNVIAPSFQVSSSTQYLVADPMFEDPSAGNYTLSNRSPAINAGDNSQIPSGMTVDFAGNARVQNGSVDLGVFESALNADPILISDYPLPTSVCEGQMATLQIKGAASNVYQWQYDTGGGWTDFVPGIWTGGATVVITTESGTSTLIITQIARPPNAFQVRAVLVGQSFITPPVTVTVNPRAVIHVDASAPAGGDGTTWATAYNDLGFALGRLNACRNKLWVAQGTYSTNGYYIPSGTEMYGGFPAGGSDFGVRDPQAYPTILTRAATAAYVGPVVSFHTATNFVLDGFTVSGSTGTVGINVHNSSGTLKNLTVTGHGQVGLELSRAPVQVENCRFVSNPAVGASTVQVFEQSHATFLNCVFQGNSSRQGGGLAISKSNPQLRNVLITGNRAEWGGGIMVYSGTPILVNCTVAGNTGGGISAYGNEASVTVKNSLVWGNRAGASSLEKQQVLLENGGTAQFANTSIEGQTTYAGVQVNGFDPIFLSPQAATSAPTTAGNYRVSACSPALGAGDVAAASPISIDLDNQARVTGGKVDLGPYQSGLAAAATLKITTQPQPLTYRSSGVNQFTVVAVGEGLTYEWQMNHISLVGVSGFSGANTSTLTLDAVTPVLNGATFRCVVSSSAGCTIYSTAVPLTVYPFQYYVNGATGNDGNSGFSWGTSFKTIGRALQAQMDPSGTAIWVAQGTYTTPLNTNESWAAAYRIPTNVCLYGGFTGTETALEQRNWTLNPTIVEAAASYVRQNNSSRIYTSAVFILSGTSTAGSKLDGLIIRNSPTGVVADRQATGAALVNCTVTNCEYGVWNFDNARLQVVDSRFAQNYIGFQLSSGSVVMTNSVFTENVAGINADSGGLTVMRGDFQGNGTSIGGTCDLTVRDTAFTTNTSGIRLQGGNVLIQRSTFRGNGGNEVFEGAAFRHAGNGGGITLESSLFSGNRAKLGGAIYVARNAGLILRNCTLSGNRDYAIYSTTHGNVQCYNTILWGNITTDLAPSRWTSLTPGMNPALRQANYEVSGFAQINNGLAGSHNVIQNPEGTAWFAGATSSANPAFMSELDPASAPDAGGDFRLSPCSPVLALGDPAQIGASATDLAGAPRQFSGQVSVGAYQAQSALLHFTQQPVNAVGTLGQDVSFTATVADATGVSYQWQGSANGVMFTNLPNSAPFSGVNTATLTLAGAKIHDGASFRLAAQYPVGCAIYSQAASYDYVLASGTTAGLRNNVLPVGGKISLAVPGGFNAGSANDQSIAMYGMQSGRAGLSFALNGNELTFTPSRPFHAGEVISVTANSNLKTAGGIAAQPRTWQFVNDVVSWNGAFAAPAKLAAGPALANTAAAGDVNGDGNLDLVISAAGGCRVLLNDGTGNFIDTMQEVGTTLARKVVLGDTHGDGQMDLLLVRDGALEVWTNDGSGFFTAAATYAAVSVTDIALGDLNNDGTLDLFVVSPAANFVWWNNGTGQFVESGFILPSLNGASVSLGDFNADGNLDAIVVSKSADGLLWLNQGGIFTAVTAVFSGYERVLTGDVNDDGRLDLIVASRSSGNQGYVQVLKGNGQGQFSYLSEATGISVGTLAAGDLNGDRRTDFVMTTRDGYVLPQVSTGTAFEKLPYQGSLGSAAATVLADFNGDGALDLIVINPQGDVNLSAYEPMHLRGNQETRLFVDAASFPAVYARRQENPLVSVKITSLPAHGTLYLSGVPVVVDQVVPVGQLASLAYESEVLFHGRDQFTWQGIEGTGLMASVFNFQITLVPVPHNVVPANDAFSVAQGQTATLLTGGAASVLANDVNVDGGTFLARLDSPPAHGSLTLNADGNFSYTHNGSATHTDSFTYVATNATTGRSGSAMVSISITGVNHTPTDIVLSSNIIYEGEVAGTLVGQLSAANPDPLHTQHVFELVSGTGDADNAAFSIVGNNLVTAGPLSFTQGLTRSIRVRTTDQPTAFDSGGATYEEVLTIQVVPLPAGMSQTVDVNENVARAITLTGTRALSYAITVAPTNGVLVGTAPNLVYLPATNFFGTDYFAFTVSDGVKTSVATGVDIIVHFVNQPPEVEDLNLATLQNAPVNVTLLGTPFLHTHTLTYAIVDPPAVGTLSGTPPNLIYTPPTNFHGSIGFTYTATDEGLVSRLAFAFIDIQHVNQAPVAASRTHSVQQDSSVSIPLIASDSDFDALTYRIVTPPSNGVVTGGFSGVPSLAAFMGTYQPQRGFAGTDTFTFVANDGVYDSAPATITITVAGLPIPTAFPQTVVTTVDQPVNFTLTGLAAEGNAAALSYRVLTYPEDGQLALNGALPNLTYTPASKFIGTNYLTFIVSQGFESAPATVAIIVNPVLPVAHEARYTNLLGISIDLTLTGSSPNGLPLTYQIVSGPQNGTIVGTALPQFNYTPETNYYGEDTVTFTVNDGLGTSLPATITIVIPDLPYAPRTTPAMTNVFVGIPQVINVLEFASDPKDEPLTVVSVESSLPGSIVISNNLVVVTVADDYSGANGSFNYVVSNRHQTATGIIGLGIVRRTVVVGGITTEIRVIGSDVVMGVPTVEEAVAFVNSFGSGPEWRIELPSFPPIPDVYELALPSAASRNGNLSALEITGNVKILPQAPGTSVILEVNSELPFLRAFQVATNGRLRLENCVVRGGSSGEGGAIYNEGRLELFQSTLAENSARGSGGAIYNYNGVVALTNSFLTNNTASVAGGIYQMGDGASATLLASNTVISGSSGAGDFWSTNANGGTSTMDVTRFLVEKPTLPWFGPLGAGYTVKAGFSVDFPVLFNPSAYQFTVTPETPWGDASHLLITGAGTSRTLTLTPAATGPRAVRDIAVSLGNGGLSYVQRFSLTVDPAHNNAPVAKDDFVAAGTLRSVKIPVLLNDLNLDGPHGQLSIVNVSIAGFGTVTIEGTNVVYHNTDNLTFTDSFTYEVSNGILSSTATVKIELITPAYSSHVTTAHDAGGGSLRQSLAYAARFGHGEKWNLEWQDGYVVNAAVADGKAAGLSAYEIANDVTIDAGDVTGATIQLAEDAAPMRLFHVKKGATLTLINLTLSGGHAMTGDQGFGQGGAIYNEGTVRLINCTLINNRVTSTNGSPSLGGAIYNLGDIEMTGSALLENTAEQGGGIYQYADGTMVRLVMTNSYLHNPQSSSDVEGVRTNGGLVSTRVYGSAVNSPATPWVSGLTDIYISSTNSLVFYVGEGTNGPTHISVESDNDFILPASQVTITGTNEVKRLSISASKSGLVNLLITAENEGVSYGRSFTMGIVAEKTLNPIVTNDVVSVYRGEIATLEVLANDVSPSGSDLTLEAVSAASYGTVSIVDNRVVYTHNGGEATSDFFTYTVVDEFGGRASGTVAVTIVPAVVQMTSSSEFGPGSIQEVMRFTREHPLAGEGIWTIRVDSSLAGKTLRFFDFEPGQGSDYTAYIITNRVRIDGTDAPGFTISTLFGDLRLFRVTEDAVLELVNLRLKDGGTSAYGGENEGQREGLGGAIFNEGRFDAKGVTFYRNFAGSGADDLPGAGGAVFNRGGIVLVEDSVFDGNGIRGDNSKAVAGLPFSGALGGAMFNHGGTMEVRNCTFVNNTASTAPGIFNGGSTNTATLFIRENSMSNGASLPDVVGATAGAGISDIYSRDNEMVGYGVPAIAGVANQSISGEVDVPFTFTSGTASPVLSATSSLQAVIPDANLSIETNGNAGILTITPGIYAGNVVVSLKITEGNLRYTELIPVAVSGQPMPHAVTFQTTEKQALTFDVLESHAGLGLSVAAVNTAGALGTTVLNGDGTVTYDPNSKFNALNVGQTSVDTFTCTVTNMSGQSGIMTVSVTVNGVNDMPVVRSIVLHRGAGQEGIIPMDVLLAQIQDVDDTSFTLVQYDAYSTNGASIQLNGNNFVYAADAPAMADMFRFIVMDAHGNWNEGAVHMLVRPADFVPAGVDGADFVMQFMGLPTARYQLQYTADLRNPTWVPLETITVGPNGRMTFRDPAPSDTQRFYRVVPVEE